MCDLYSARRNKALHNERVWLRDVMRRSASTFPFFFFSYHRKTRVFYMAPGTCAYMLHAFIKTIHLHISSFNLVHTHRTDTCKHPGAPANFVAALIKG